MTRKNIVEQLREANQVIKNLFHAEITAVYGSYARGDQSPQSDLDVLYRVNSPERFGLIEIDGLENYIKELVKVPSVDLVNEKYVNPIIQLEIESELIHV